MPLKVYKMFGEGGLSRYKVNMSMLTKKHYFNKKTEKYERYDESHGNNLPSTTPEKLEKVRAYILREEKKEKRRLMIIL